VVGAGRLVGLAERKGQRLDDGRRPCHVI
jgi:hypothetical protein